MGEGWLDPRRVFRKHRANLEISMTQPTTGARAHNRQRTEERIAEAALELFLQNGYDETTVQDIARAADIAPRTFFHYFPSKESLIEGRKDEARAVMIQAIAEASIEKGPLAAAEAALASSALSRSGQTNRGLLKLIERTPALRAREQLKNDDLTRMMGEALLARFAGAISRLEAHLAAAVAVGAFAAAVRIWMDEGGAEDPLAFSLRVRTALHERVLRWRGADAPR
jgi:AcrR family transcriptional regulator